LNSSIIIVSLALGIAIMNLITLFIHKENNVDGFQKNRDRIYALNCMDPWKKENKIYYVRFGAAEYMKNNFSEVENFCRISNASPSKVTVAKNDFFDEKLVIAASSNFFEFFSYHLLSNISKNVLVTKQDIVISQNLASKYFGTSNPIGKKVTFVNGDKQCDMIVSGVFKKPEESTQLNFDMVRLIGDDDSRCYVLLAKNTNVGQLEEKFAKNKASIPIINDGTPGSYFLKDMRSAYFDPLRSQTIEKNRSKTDLIFALIIALMILAVALFNYLGLIKIRMTEKSKEHSIRRINGGSKVNLMFDFLIETVILIVMAFLLSIWLTIEFASFFNGLTASYITTAYILRIENVFLMMTIPVLILVVTYLFAILKIGKGVQIQALKSGKLKPLGNTQIPVFHVTQLAISVVLIVGSLVITKQINYITDKDIGLNKEVLEVKIPSQNKNLAPVFKLELEKHPSIEVVSLANASPVLEHILLLLKYNDNGKEKQYTPSVFVGDQNYTRALGIKIIAGEDFSKDAASSNHKCIINESLAKLFHNQDLIGKELPGNNETVVIGIAKDFHYGSLKGFIEPGYITYNDKGSYLMVKPFPGQEVKVRELVSKTWNKLITNYPLNMESISERYKWMHRENSNYAKLVGTCCGISVFLSMIGLFVVSLKASQRRIKEIGIRRVNGASAIEILAMLNKDFIKWVAIAFIIACPIAWFATHQWLQYFAYKTELNWWVFAVAGIVAVTVALLTVSWQSWRAATRNPVEALRYE
jgi:putative ABC transport system permease protein